MDRLRNLDRTRIKNAVATKQAAAPTAQRKIVRDAIQRSVRPTVYKAPPVPMPTPTGPKPIPIQRGPMAPISTTPAYNPWDSRMQEEWFANLRDNNPMSPVEGFGYPNPTIGSRMLDRSTEYTYGDNSPLSQYIDTLAPVPPPSWQVQSDPTGGLVLESPVYDPSIPGGDGTVAQNPLLAYLQTIYPEIYGRW